MSRTDSAEQLAALLRTARDSLGLPLAFLSRMDGVTQHIEVMESPLPVLFKEGQEREQSSSLCQAVQDGVIPEVVPDLRAHPEVASLPAVSSTRLRSYVSVPVTLSDGSVYGSFCAAGFKAKRSLSARDGAMMKVLAQAAAAIVEPSAFADRDRLVSAARYLPLLASRDLEVVFQPIVSLDSGKRLGAEALSRFPAEWALAPDVCFAEAHRLGLGEELELLALGLAGEALAGVSGYVSMNVSPQVLLSPGFTALALGLPLERVLLELSEHDPVEDYDALSRVLDPLRAKGMRLAIDDVGSGYSSLRHIVITSPEVLKLDRMVVDGISSDTKLEALVGSMCGFAENLGASIVAEGIETEEDAAVLRRLGVSYGQGWLFGRPGPVSGLSDVSAPAVPAPRGSLGVPVLP